MSYPRIASLVVVLTFVLAATVTAQQENVLDVGMRSQLFVDASAIYESSHISFTPQLGRKAVVNPLLRADQPWEGWYVTVFAGTVLFDEEAQRFKMWYVCPGDRAYFDSYVICYAESRDGLQWDKPLVGTLQAKNGKPHNAVSALHCPSVFKDLTDPDPTRRYKMICFDVTRGYMAQVSPDGLTWRDQSEKAIMPISYVDDVVTAFRDRRSGRFVALPKMTTPVFGRLRRTIYLSSSSDFREWSKPEPSFIADRRDDLGSLARIERVRPLLNYPDNPKVMRTEFYGAGAYSAESCVIGFPWVFTVNSNVKPGTNQEGPIETQLAVSRDLESWSRPWRTPIIPMGGPSDWDRGMILTASQAIDVRDEVWLYYCGSNYTHGAPILYGREVEGGKSYTGMIGLATWQRDRFVAAEAGEQLGMLTTVPLRFRGNKLELNAATADGGEIRVELLDNAGQPLAGLAISEPILGDQLRHSVQFSSKPDLSALSTRPISIRFHLRNARLFAFAFRE